MSKGMRLRIARGLAALCLLLCVLPAAAQYDRVFYYHTDALGSVVAISDENANIVERYEYEPYGQVLNQPLQDGPGYTGHVADAATGFGQHAAAVLRPAVRQISVP